MDLLRTSTFKFIVFLETVASLLEVNAVHCQHMWLSARHLTVSYDLLEEKLETCSIVEGRYHYIHCSKEDQWIEIHCWAGSSTYLLKTRTRDLIPCFDDKFHFLFTMQELRQDPRINRL